MLKNNPNWNMIKQGPQKALIYADGVNGIIIQGGGTIDGSGNFTGDYGSESSRPSGILLVGCDHSKIQNIAVNNAGTSSASSFETVDADLWQTDLDLKLFGAIHTSKAAIPYMRKEGGGAIVNVTAVLAKTPPASSLPTTVSRAAGMALTKAMSNDLCSKK